MLYNHLNGVHDLFIATSKRSNIQPTVLPVFHERFFEQHAVVQCVFTLQYGEFIFISNSVTINERLTEYRYWPKT